MSFVAYGELYGLWKCKVIKGGEVYASVYVYLYFVNGCVVFMCTKTK